MKVRHVLAGGAALIVSFVCWLGFIPLFMTITGRTSTHDVSWQWWAMLVLMFTAIVMNAFSKHRVFRVIGIVALVLSFVRGIPFAIDLLGMLL